MSRSGGLLSIVVLLLAACAALVERLPVSAPLAETIYVDPPVGRTVTQVLQDGDIETWTVAAVDENGVRYRIAGGGEEDMPTPFWSSTRWVRSDYSGTSRNEGDPKALYPLAVGKTAEWMREGMHKGKAFTSLTRCEVKDQVRVSVPAGEFDTYEVVCFTGGSREQPYATNTYYYAPSVNQPVKLVRKTRDRQDEWGFELVSLTDPQ